MLVLLIFSILLVLLYTLGWSVSFSCTIQYELELFWLTTVAGSQDVFCLCWTQTAIPGVNSMQFLSGLFGCLLMSSWWVSYISWAPSVLGTWGKSFSLGVRWVMSCNGEAMPTDYGVTLYSYRPEIHGFPLLPALSINFLATPTILSTKPLDLGWCGLLVWCVML